MTLIETYSIESLREIRHNLAQELSDASNNISNSLAFARHDLGKNRPGTFENAQVLVIGGSNCVSAKATKTARGIVIDSMTEEPLPVFDNGETFLDYISVHISESTSLLGLNFAYPMTPTIRDNRLDGCLIKGTKEHTFDDVVGREVGFLVEEHLLKERQQKVQVVTANDTVCLILSGLEKYSTRGLAGGVIGTGFNFGFFLDDDTLINLESGNYNNFQRSDSCMAMDEELEDRGCQLWEKEISGAYLFRHYNYYAQKLKITPAVISSTIELDKLADNDTSPAGDLAREILTRSASFAATQIAAIHDFLPVDTLNVLIEGSLYWKGWQYRHNVMETLSSLGFSENSVYIDMIPRSHVVGGALLALGK